MDLVFLLEDRSCLHIEVQSTAARLEPFWLYDARLYERHPRQIRTLLLYTGNIRAAPDTLDTGSICYRLHNVLLAELDGQEQRARIAAMPARSPGVKDQVCRVLAVFAGGAADLPGPAGYPGPGAEHPRRRYPRHAHRRRGGSGQAVSQCRAKRSGEQGASP